MSSIITLAHQKGGVGKSTIALNLYSYFAQAGLSTVIVDIDPQGSIASFASSSELEGFNLIRRTDFTTYADLREKIKAYEIVIIDTPPYLSKELIEIIAITNIVIIPCKASLFDTFAIAHTIEFIQSQATINPHLISAIVLTMVISGASLQSQIREHLEQYRIPVFKTEIGNRVAYAKSLFLTGNVMQDDAGKAREEMENLANEILNLIPQA
jgi:chromosome partitioning protein